jgi:hypothetical protein
MMASAPGFSPTITVTTVYAETTGASAAATTPAIRNRVNA